MDEGGRLHHVHSFLLALKIPLFRRLGKIRHVILAGASADVVELIIGMVYGMDRFPFECMMCSNQSCGKISCAGDLMQVSAFWSSSLVSPSPLASRT